MPTDRARSHPPVAVPRATPPVIRSGALGARRTFALVGAAVVLAIGAGASGCGAGSGPGADGRGAGPTAPSIGVRGREPEAGATAGSASAGGASGDRDRCAGLDRFVRRVAEAVAVAGDAPRRVALTDHLAADLAAVAAGPEDLRHALDVWHHALLELAAADGGPPGAPPPGGGAPPARAPGSAGVAAGVDPSVAAARVAAVLGRPEVVAAIDRIEREVRAGCR